MNTSDDDFVKRLSEVLLGFANFSQDNRIKNKIEAKRVSALADWKSMIKQYFAAHQLAIGKHWK